MTQGQATAEKLLVPTMWCRLPARMNVKLLLSFVADRNVLYAAWNAVANLADVAGEVSISARAKPEEWIRQEQVGEWRPGAAARTRTDQGRS